MRRDDDVYIKIPIRVFNMLSMDGYMYAFWNYVQEGCTHMDAYYACERDLNRYGIPARYTSYESFKSAKTKREGLEKGGLDISFV